MEIARQALPTESGRLERWPWNIIETGKDNLDLVACKLLAPRGGVRIIPHDGNDPDRYLWVYVSRSNRKLLDNLKKEREYITLQQAMYGISELAIISASTVWDEKTKSQVLGLFWQRRSEFFIRQKAGLEALIPTETNSINYWEHRTKIDYLDIEIMGNRDMSLKVLGNNSPLSPEDINNLVRNMITTVEAKLTGNSR